MTALRNKLFKNLARDRRFGRAVNEMLVKRETMVTNEPINRREGNTAQANSERATKNSIDRTLDLVASVAAGRRG